MTLHDVLKPIGNQTAGVAEYYSKLIRARNCKQCLGLIHVVGAFSR